MNTKLINARKETGLTQVQVADKANVASRVYQKYEAGECLPRVDAAIRIAQALDTTVEELFAVADDGNSLSE